MSSGLFVPTIASALTGGIVLDLDLATHKVALFSSAISPNYDTNTAYGVSPFNANEMANSGNYTTGGTLLVSPTFALGVAGSVKFDATDTAWASSTITNAHYGLIYADALAGNNAIVLVDFGADYSTVAGTFTIQWAAGGIFTIDLTP